MLFCSKVSFFSMQIEDSCMNFLVIRASMSPYFYTNDRIIRVEIFTVHKTPSIHKKIGREKKIVELVYRQDPGKFSKSLRSGRTGEAHIYIYRNELREEKNIKNTGKCVGQNVNRCWIHTTFWWRACALFSFFYSVFFLPVRLFTLWLRVKDCTKKRGEEEMKKISLDQIRESFFVFYFKFFFFLFSKGLFFFFFFWL